MFSCDEDPLSSEEQAAQAILDDPRPQLLMTMSSDLELTLNVEKFEETVSYMTLQVIFNPAALNDLIEDSLPPPGPFTLTSTVLNPLSIAS